MSIDKTHGMSYNIVNEIGITYSSETEMNSPDKKSSAKDGRTLWITEAQLVRYFPLSAAKTT